MAIIQDPDDTTQVKIEANTRSMRTTQRPLNLSTLGAYSLAMDNGATVFTAGAQTAAEFFQLRWTDATRVALIRSIRVHMGSVVAFAAGKLAITGTVARAFTAVGSGTGSTTATLTTNNNKKRTSMGSSLLTGSNVVMAGTAFLSAGTKTLDAQPFANISNAAPTTVGPIYTNCMLWNRDEASEWPLVLAADEGLVLRLTCPATGTFYLGVVVEWDEILSSTYQ